ncbi:MAG TPA: HypC/HybG/HupF family hydrogenase formation chaperone [Methylomusa anaerophila]|uniref:Hydrogenase isoenzymes formation protein HypC n=1 Tax=Methylomusa anaerophila TaxID=1930071 RepID=A0A348AL14_9FIRM|nr:HypC/HybG/HupF family hydrogenase formation chaperone [Methylomusa anaerophila]BBB91762.1 hydrogenase isoenzymes formation protein HypC [Methylomusa anaerophila]HML88501.1 HypC/HybG/HupF family hydrogenase formation chaperone [Methylomusa anaerophila]
MCLAVPARIISKEDFIATVDISGVTRQVSLMLLPEARIGEYVLIHAGFAIQSVDEEEARRTLELFRELERDES